MYNKRNYTPTPSNIKSNRYELDAYKKNYMINLSNNPNDLISKRNVNENINSIKFPLYIDFDNVFTSVDKIIETNNYIKSITKIKVLEKNFCILLNRHDFGNTRLCIYDKLTQLGNIICPSNLLNNFPNDIFEKIGRIKFQKQFVFSICPENFITSLDGYITEKLFFACICGNIPIYYGKLDNIDKQIFNINRIILYDPTNIESINNVYNLVKELLENPDKLYNYYKQDIFLNTASEIINKMKENLFNKINLFFTDILNVN